MSHQEVRRAGPLAKDPGSRQHHSDEGMLPLIGDRQPDGAQQAWQNADDWWGDSAWRALTWMADLGQPFDAWDLTLLGVPDPDSPKRWGGLFRVAYQKGLIEPVGYGPSRRPTAAGSACRVWRGVGPDASR
jgi:hypothetical protein